MYSHRFFFCFFFPSFLFSFFTRVITRKWRNVKQVRRPAERQSIARDKALSSLSRAMLFVRDRVTRVYRCVSMSASIHAIVRIALKTDRPGIQRHKLRLSARRDIANLRELNLRKRASWNYPFVICLVRSTPVCIPDAARTGSKGCLRADQIFISSGALPFFFYGRRVVRTSRESSLRELIHE